VRIAQAAPLVLLVPPVRYGGTERVIFALTEELVRLGHDVTLFAAGTSRTSARLIPCSPRPLWDLDPSESVAYPHGQLDRVRSRFGLVFIEALASGTPVISHPRGSVPEFLRDGEHGFLVESEDELVEACRNRYTIDRRACRDWALQRFSVERMTTDYLRVYRKIIDGAREPAA